MIGPLSISDLPAVEFDGVWRVLGCLPETEESKDRFPKFGESMLCLDPSQWQEIDLSWYKPTILNQLMTSSCVAHASCSGMETCWMQAGNNLLEFNQYFLYALINGGRDAGAMISDALTALKEYGICLKNDMPLTLSYRNQIPQSALSSAVNYKLIEAYHCATFEEICSAISLGFVVPFGILVGSNFAHLDGDGVAPLPMGGGGGHAICGVGLKKSQRYGWIIKFQNSWGPSYGLGGYGYVCKNHFNYMGGQDSTDAFAIQIIQPGHLI